MHQLYLFLTLLCWYPGLYHCGIISIAPDDSIAIMDCDYYYKCTLELSIFDLASVAKTPFTFSSPYKTCNVTNWIYCTVPFPEDPDDGYCACTGKHNCPDNQNNLCYTFTFFRAMMTSKDHQIFVTCNLGTFSSASKQTNLHGFNKKPGTIATVCEGQNLTFGWDFGFSYDFSKKYRVIEVAWKLGENNLLKCSKRDQLLFDCKPGPDIDERSVTWVEQFHNVDQGIPQLIYLGVPKELDNIIVAIAIVFEYKLVNATTEDKDKGKIKRQLSEDELPFEYDSNSSDYFLSTTPKRTEPRKITTTTTSTTTRRTVTTTTTATTTPKPYDFHIEYKQYIVRDHTKLEILEHPSDVMILDFGGSKTLTGEVIASCELSKTTRLGNPPVNLTIWHNDKVIITREKTYLLRYMMRVDKGNLTCGIVGPSANCYGPAWLENQKEVLDIKDIVAEKVEYTNIDVNLLIYMAESLVCLVLMIITTALIIEHIKAILRRQRRLLEIQMLSLKIIAPKAAEEGEEGEEEEAAEEEEAVEAEEDDDDI